MTVKMMAATVALLKCLCFVWVHNKEKFVGYDL